MDRDRAVRQHAEQIVVGHVISRREDDPRARRSGRQDTLEVHALVDASGPDLDHAATGENLGGDAGEHVLERDQELPGPPDPVLGLGLAIVPGNARGLPLDHRPRDVRGNPPEEALDPREPAKVDVERRRPLPARRANQVPMLGTERNWQVAEPGVERLACPTADDMDARRRQRGEVAQEIADLGGGNGEVRMADELTQRSVVVEHERALRRLREEAANARPGRTVEWPSKPSLRAREPLEPCHENDFRAHLVLSKLLDAARHQLEPPAALGGIECECLDQPRGQLVDIPGVDEHGAGQHVRGARELAQEQRPSLARASAGIVRLALDELLGNEVHAVAERCHHHHVGSAVESDQLGR